MSPLGDNWHPIHVGEETAPPEPAVPPGAVTAGMVEAAQAYDLAHRSNYVSWTRPPDYQVARLLAGPCR